MGSSNPLSTLMHRMTVSSKPKNNGNMSTTSAKKSATVIKRAERQPVQPVAGAHTNLRSQSKKRPSAGEVELDNSEDELVMVEAEYDQHYGAAVQDNGAPQQPKRRRSHVQFQDAVVPKIEDDGRKDSAVDVAMKRKFSMHDFCGTLRIMTGRDQFILEYQRTLLVRNSDYFRRATEVDDFDPRLAFDFTEFDPSIFTIWLVWLSSNNIENAKECIVVPDGLGREELQKQTFLKRLQLINCYVLGERLIDRNFKNQIMDTLIAHCKFVNDTFGPVDGLGNGARLVYEKTKSSSLLRRFVLENYFATGSFADCKPRAPGDKCDDNCAITEQFYLDLAKIGMRVVRKERAAPLPPWEQHHCYYHDHSDQDAGYTCEQ